MSYIDSLFDLFVGNVRNGVHVVVLLRLMCMHKANEVLAIYLELLFVVAVDFL